MTAHMAAVIPPARVRGGDGARRVGAAACGAALMLTAALAALAAQGGGDGAQAPKRAALAGEEGAEVREREALRKRVGWAEAHPGANARVAQLKKQMWHWDAPPRQLAMKTQTGADAGAAPDAQAAARATAAKLARQDWASAHPADDAEVAGLKKQLWPPVADAVASRMALALLRDSETSSDAQLGARVQQAVHAASLWLKPAAPEQMLADAPDMMTERGRFGSAMSLAGDDGESKLCQKKQVLIDKFNALLAKLGVNFEQANHTMSQVRKEWMDAMDAWLDAESAYRLGEQRAKEAREGAKFATDEYEKWAQANKAARKSLAETLARHGKDRADLLNEKALIKEIMRLIGVLHDVKATEKSIAAGGRDSVCCPSLRSLRE